MVVDLASLSFCCIAYVFDLFVTCILIVVFYCTVDRLIPHTSTLCLSRPDYVSSKISDLANKSKQTVSTPHYTVHYGIRNHLLEKSHRSYVLWKGATALVGVFFFFFVLL